MPVQPDLPSTGPDVARTRAASNGSPSTDRPGAGAAPRPATRPATRPVTRPVARTRAGAAWVGIVVGALVLVLLIVFMLQNTAPVEVTFLGMTGSAPLALTLLIAGVGVGIVALVVGTVRIAQLRRRIGADRRSPD